jgi:hypothetical protein
MLNGIFFVALLLAVSLADPALGHYVWLERDGEGVTRGYLGEWIDDIREKSGGMLDRIKAPKVFLGAGTETLSVKRNENNLEFPTKGRGDVRLVEDSMAPREDNEKGGLTKTIYYAKAGRSETAAKLNLELVPTRPDGNTLALMFHGASLPRAEVIVVGPPKWQKTLVTDEKGQITLPTPWAGRYVLEVTHFEDKPGGSGSEKFNRTRHISSLSFVHNDGIRWTEKR